ncbi:hypothetical protein [Planctellipticum variicoloris]|uniref:hypothetical protein n=1 Tax=Planctellipticum variicoloris TaxID=3064265 RepID=UPI00301367A6|nr:hypothetical protein SH412_003804 [Planctomycetaceae bacterium SH412]
MSATVEAPVELVEAIAHLRLPSHVDAELQKLMDANTRGELTNPQRERLDSLVEWSESVSLLRASALHLLGEPPA